MNRKYFFQSKSGVSPSNEINTWGGSRHDHKHHFHYPHISQNILHQIIVGSGQTISPLLVGTTKLTGFMKCLCPGSHVAIDQHIHFKSLPSRKPSKSRILNPDTIFSLNLIFPVLLRCLFGKLKTGIASSLISLRRWTCVLKNNFRLHHISLGRISFSKKAPQCSPVSFSLIMEGGR